MMEKKLNLVLIFVALAQFINCQNPCQNGGVQVLKPATSLDQVCICQKNYIGKNCEVKIDQLSSADQAKYGCELKPCNIGATCEDRPDGSYVCHCPTNFGGNTCQNTVASDPCASKPCYNGGTCIKTSATTSTCICGTSFSGPTCKLSKTGACAANPCQRDGLCVNSGSNDYKCQCPDWTIGKACEVVFNPCSRVNCQNSGSCLKRRTLAYECNCGSLWTGNTCEQSSVNTVTASGVSTASTPTSTQANTNSSCFPGSTLVETMNRGSIHVSDLKQGDFVKSYDSNTQEWKFSRFVFFLHRDDDILTEYISIKTSSNKNLLISSMHLIPKRTSNNDIDYILAKNLQINDILISENNENEKIIELNKVLEKGAFAPLLETGTISVNNLLASCYANTKWHDLVHFAFQPIIKLSNYMNVENQLIETNNIMLPNGVNWYAGLLTTFLPYIPLSSSFVYL